MSQTIHGYSVEVCRLQYNIPAYNKKLKEVEMEMAINLLIFWLSCLHD